ncbi:MAG: AAA family ATPase [Planctomycetes bacterium]|nr:AAA family ATPase [Planctomycetota bacterium]
MQVLYEILAGVAVLIAFVGLIAGGVAVALRVNRRNSISQWFKRHFHPLPLQQLTVTERQFPMQLRADLQRALDEYLETATVHYFCGAHVERGFGSLDFASLLDESLFEMSVGAGKPAPPQYEQIDIGEAEPIRCLKNGIWFLEHEGAKLAIMCAPASEFGGCGPVHRLRFQAAANDDGGRRATKAIFDRLEQGIQNAKCYRGKVLSLEQDESYLGQARGVKVHRLRSVPREELILPEKTLELLDRNVRRFIEQRAALGRLKMATKKGLLFYGPPGAGKTHTIRYLAGTLPGHTTFLISAEQVGLLGEYMTLARLLQPSIVVVEDVDLIARERTRMRNVTSELLLNKLLNEMDGLREDCDVIFILTTNRPEELEAALAARPGRIDQAIEFPLPDARGREQLLRLYSRGLVLPEEVVRETVRRTEKISPSFIKELMRRAAGRQLERNGSSALAIGDIENALDEMLFRGGSLNLKLLGAAEWSGDEPA